MKAIEITRPRATEGRVYIKVDRFTAEDDDVVPALRSIMGRPVLVVRAPCWDPSKSVPYLDGDGERVISAARVERAVDDADFIALANRQGMNVTFTCDGTVFLWRGGSDDMMAKGRSVRAAYFAAQRRFPELGLE